MPGGGSEAVEPVGEDRLRQDAHDDDLLVRREREREFKVLFRAMASELLGYSAARVGPDHAEDIVSETFATVWRRWDAAMRYQHAGNRDEELAARAARRKTSA